MTRSTYRRAAAVLAAGTALGLAGCSAGQVTETARKVPAVAGANATSEVGTGELSVRDVQIIYGTVKGYLKGGAAPVGGAVFNDTPDPVTVTVTVDQAPTGAAGAQTVTANGVQLVKAKLTAPQPATGGHGAEAPAPAEGAGAAGHAGGTGAGQPAPTASAEPTPAQPTGTPEPGPTATAAGGTRPVPATPTATFPLAPWGSLTLGATQGQYLELAGLAGPLKGGMSVPLRFAFSNGVVLTVLAPVGSPLAPLPRETAHGESPAH
ncbi:hypothetical protein GCM10010124_01220 [Pilimelia terevasa]|uniref:Uncharacterized protein n=1 Tax=Pilimelia terevasa TaxID=53372 RepID=A0A8J3FH26_9ACTN|nr:hypothetical protein [Pilimelia terevasa]GGK12451.1 hypothetical protein GCM10010124_01220 [Pilimelia terevasa]